jgi:CheY-like chemotaxis protein
VLTKPFSVPELQRAIAEAMAAKRRG